ncbi:serine/threonine transporter SstT [Congregibacter variabilis]|uniref:Serine/threonine transporter SstT n=1 Tax=Congregibacter variabilis TaxID=3081200 RepID=A0ABZ0I4T7_9GAMM|nr:serine/threonine transporter SstT [Congregibacter sp. IMCC43200]
MALSDIGLVPRIVIGVIAGAAMGMFWPSMAVDLGLLGQLFVAMLKAVAPLLVMLLVMSAIANRHEKPADSRRILITLILYFVGTMTAALVALLLSTAFPQTLTLTGAADGAPPAAVGNVLRDVLFKLVDNPINALLTGNFLGCLSWAILLGLSFRRASETFRQNLQTLADGVADVVRYVIALAPIGIFGLVCFTVATIGVEVLADYVGVAGLLVAAMLIVALLVNPLYVWLLTRKNPYPVVFRCLEESGVTAFFTRSSAANIPVNLALAKRLGISEELYSVTIPVGATVNMAGAAITITTLSVAAAHTLGVEVSFAQALMLCIVSSLAACGASGVPSGSLLLIPLACGLFGIPLDIAMQVVAVGFIISVIQDSAETALNSSTDVVYTYAAEHARIGDS